MHRSPKKASFVRRLDFGSDVLPEGSGKLKPWKTIKWGRSTETLAVELDTTPKLLRQHRRNNSSEDNPFTPAYRNSLTGKRTESKKCHDIFDVLPPCSTPHHDPTLLRVDRRSPRLSSTSKSRLCAKKNSIRKLDEEEPKGTLSKKQLVGTCTPQQPKTEAVNATSKEPALGSLINCNSSQKIEVINKSPKLAKKNTCGSNGSSAEYFTCQQASSPVISTSKFAVSDSAKQDVEPVYGISPRFRSPGPPGHQTWKETTNSPNRTDNLLIRTSRFNINSEDKVENASNTHGDGIGISTRIQKDTSEPSQAPSQESPSFVMDTPSAKPRKSFKRKRLGLNSKRKELQGSQSNPERDKLLSGTICTEKMSDLLSPSFIASPSWLEKPKRRKRSKRKDTVSPVLKSLEPYPGTPPKTENIPTKIGIDCGNLFMASPAASARPVSIQFSPIIMKLKPNKLLKTAENYSGDSPKRKKLVSSRNSPSSICLQGEDELISSEQILPTENLRRQRKLGSKSSPSSSPSNCGKDNGKFLEKTKAVRQYLCAEGSSPVIARMKPRRSITPKKSSSTPDQSPKSLKTGESSLQSPNCKNLSSVAKMLFTDMDTKEASGCLKRDTHHDSLEDDLQDSVIPSSLFDRPKSRRSILKKSKPVIPWKDSELSPRTKELERGFSSAKSKKEKIRHFEKSSPILVANTTQNKSLQLSPVINVKNKSSTWKNAESNKKQIRFEEEPSPSFANKISGSCLSAASNPLLEISPTVSTKGGTCLDLSLIEETQQKKKKRVVLPTTVASNPRSKSSPSIFQVSHKVIDVVKNRSPLISSKQKIISSSASSSLLFSPKRTTEENDQTDSVKQKRLGSPSLNPQRPLSPVISTMKKKWRDVSLIEETQKQIGFVKNRSPLLSKIEKTVPSPPSISSNPLSPPSPTISLMKKRCLDGSSIEEPKNHNYLMEERRVSSSMITENHQPPSPTIFSILKKTRPNLYLMEENQKKVDILKKRSPLLLANERKVDSLPSCSASKITPQKQNEAPSPSISASHMKKSSLDFSLIEDTEKQADLLKMNEKEKIISSVVPLFLSPPVRANMNRTPKWSSVSREKSPDSSLLTTKQHLSPLKEKHTSVSEGRKCAQEENLEGGWRYKTKEKSSPIFKMAEVIPLPRAPASVGKSKVQYIVYKV